MRRQYDSYEEFSIGDIVYAESGIKSGQKGKILRIQDGSHLEISIKTDFNGTGKGYSKKPENLVKINCDCGNKKVHSKNRGWFCPWCEK